MMSYIFNCNCVDTRCQ